jgi:CheY-like chemotaxis protein
MRPLILIVDDDEDIRQTLGLLLELQGFRTECAFDGIDAIEKLRDHVSADLILLDLMMPRLDGVALAGELRVLPATRNVPIILLSGDSAAAEIGASLGVAACLTKPVDLDALLLTIRRVLDERMGHDLHV